MTLKGVGRIIEFVMNETMKLAEQLSKMEAC